MAMIRKLSIQGVRSFSPESNKGQWIEFGSPLTLIVGVNGSGKTTIIETLKYIITSQFPPNSAKGASFVNDPKLNYNESSLAKITLDLEDAQGNQYTTTRKIKVTVKNYKGDLSMTQLDATLRITNSKGVVKNMTNKCSEMKLEMCRLMGVSEAMLNHVIFCHQEESCWPLDEGKKVKETFDAIFNTNAYKKSFDKLTTVDKEYQMEIVKQKEGLKYVTENRDLVHGKREDLNEKRIKLQQQEDQIKEYDRDLKVIETKLREFQALEQDYAEKQSEVVEKRTKIETVGKHITELRGNIKEEYSGSMAELKEYIGQFQNECANKRDSMKQQNEEYKKKDLEWNKLNSTKSGLLRDEGMLQQEENLNKKRVEELNGHLSSIITTLKRLKGDVSEDMLSMSFSSYLEACDSQSSAGGSFSYDTVLKALLSGMKIKDSELQKIKSEFDQEESELQSVINDVRSKMAAMETERDMKREQLASGKKTLEEIKQRLKDLDSSDETLKLLDEEEEGYKERIETIENSSFMLTCDSEIKSLADEVKSFESSISTLSESVNILMVDKSKTDQIGMVSAQKRQKETECKEVMRKLEDDLKSLLEEIPEKGIGEAVDKKLKSLNDELKGNRVNLKKREEALSNTKAEVKWVNTELKKMESKLRTGKSKVVEVLEEKDYDESYTEVSNDLETTQNACSFTESASYLYKQYVTKLKKKDCCPLCKRDFESQQLTKKLIVEVEKDLTRMEDNLPEQTRKLKDLKQRQQQILEAKPLWDEIQLLETETIPGLKTKKAGLEENIEKLEEEVGDVAMVVTDIENSISTASKCRSQVAVYDQGIKEVKKYEDQISKLERSRDPEAKDITQTLEDAQTELQELQRKIRNKRSDKESKEDTRNKKRDELAKLKEKKNKVQEKKLKITAELQNRDALDTQKKQLEVDAKDLQSKITNLTQALPTVKSEITKADKDKMACIQRREGALKKIREEKDALEKQKYNAGELQKRIVDFDRKKGKLAKVQQEVAECNEKLSACEKQKKEIVSQIDKLKKDLTSQELRQRELQDNLSLKLKLEEVSKLKAELKEKEKILKQAENRGVATEKRELNTKHHTMSRKLNELRGSTTEVAKSVRELERELATPQFADVEKQYTEKVARKISYEKALRDVRVYKAALDMAIMQFHLKKMERINKILMEYWGRVYKGNDIEKIMIKTEAEQGPLEASKSKKVKVTSKPARKNYNYRVVATRKGVETDMRGRCSAGQRVLASIIIRIALAESFGAKCGIIALDEPTTNLDQANIDSLADALADLSDKMKNRKHFQLIVITHDQEFTQRLSAVDAVERYWKVFRDKEGFSQIQVVRKEGYEDD